MRRSPQERSLLCQRPLTRSIVNRGWVTRSHRRSIVNACSLTILVPPFVHSLFNNKIGVQGASALAAILKETQIANLKYATTSNRLPSVCFCVSAR